MGVSTPACLNQITPNIKTKILSVNKKRFRQTIRPKIEKRIFLFFEDADSSTAMSTILSSSSSVSSSNEDFSHLRVAGFTSRLTSLTIIRIPYQPFEIYLDVTVNSITDHCVALDEFTDTSIK